MVVNQESDARQRTDHTPDQVRWSLMQVLPDVSLLDDNDVSKLGLCTWSYKECGLNIYC